jgi:acyl-CoA thioesterase I
MVALQSCGGKPAPERQHPVEEISRSPRPEDTRPVIAAFGDSLTEGFAVDPDRSYPAVLQRELNTRGYNYRVVNMGVSGDTTTDGLARLPTVLNLRPEIVILEFGANDGLRGLPIPRAQANLERMIVALREAGATVILAGMTLPPNYGDDYIREFERMYTDLAAKYRLPLIPFLLEGVGGTELYMQRDGLHPNAAGNVKVARNVLEVLEPVLKTRRAA